MPNKVILISGGSDGLGRALAQKLAPDNQVVILAHNKIKLETAAKEIGCDFVEAELTDYHSLKSAVDQVTQKYRVIDVLVNNAGIWMEGELDENDPNKIRELIAVNTTGTIFLTKAVLFGMKLQKSGQIINIISQDGLCAKKNRSVYHASKWAITGFTKCLQEDLAQENIKVTAIYPGLMKTSLFAKSGVQRDLSNALDTSEVASLVEYVINLSSKTYIPEVGIINKTTKSQNMDDTNVPVIDLNIDPNMIAAQDSPPQTTPAGPQPVAAPATPPEDNPGVIDISPGSGDPFPSGFSEPSPQVPPSAPVTPNPVLEEVSPQSSTPVNTSDSKPEPVTQSSPLAEDPDLVKLIK